MLSLFSCKKNDVDTFDDTALRSVTYTFSPGGAQSDIGFYNHRDGRNDGRQNVATLLNITDQVKIGANIQLFMNTTNNPVGNFSIRLNINGKQVKEVSGGANNKNIQLQYTVRKEDFLQ